ncbi:MAG: hypothetical protein ACRC5A_07880 [Enterobacteriaceae bacterium]
MDAQSGADGQSYSAEFILHGEVFHITGFSDGNVCIYYANDRKTDTLIDNISFPVLKHILRSIPELAKPISTSEIKAVTNSQFSVPINIEVNPKWIDKSTRAACKYAPVIVSKGISEDTATSLQTVLHNRIETCRQLARKHESSSDQSCWFSFIRGKSEDPLPKSRLGNNTIPIMVISGGNAKKSQLTWIKTTV